MDTTYFITQAAPKNWVDMFAAFAPIVVSILAIGISIWVATRQNDLQARQLRKDLFDRRFAVYTGTREFLNFVQQRDGEKLLQGPEYGQWAETIERAEMLFGPEVLVYLREVDMAARNLYVYHAEEQKIIEAGNEKRMEEGKQLRERIYEVLPKRRNEVFRSYLSLGTSK